MESIKLVCIPYAGGLASLYGKWKKYMHPTIEIMPVELAGRGVRSGIPFYQSVHEAAADIAQSLAFTLQDESYAIWGHSVGSLIAFELAQQLRMRGVHDPLHLFFSGREGPQLPIVNNRGYALPDNAFIEEVLRYEGTPKELFDYKILAELFLPILRADFKMAETYKYNHQQEPLDADISVLFGTEDMTQEQAAAWQAATNGSCSIHAFSGGHFFINEQTEQVSNLINSVLLPTNTLITGAPLF